MRTKYYVTPKSNYMFQPTNCMIFSGNNSSRIHLGVENGFLQYVPIVFSLDFIPLLYRYIYHFNYVVYTLNNLFLSFIQFMITFSVQ